MSRHLRGACLDKPIETSQYAQRNPLIHNQENFNEIGSRYFKRTISDRF